MLFFINTSGHLNNDEVSSFILPSCRIVLWTVVAVIVIIIILFLHHICTIHWLYKYMLYKSHSLLLFINKISIYDLNWCDKQNIIIINVYSLIIVCSEFVANIWWHINRMKCVNVRLLWAAGVGRGEGQWVFVYVS